MGHFLSKIGIVILLLASSTVWAEAKAKPKATDSKSGSKSASSGSGSSGEFLEVAIGPGGSRTYGPVDYAGSGVEFDLGLGWNWDWFQLKGTYFGYATGSSKKYLLTRNTNLEYSQSLALLGGLNIFSFFTVGGGYGITFYEHDEDFTDTTANYNEITTGVGGTWILYSSLYPIDLEKVKIGFLGQYYEMHTENFSQQVRTTGGLFYTPHDIGGGLVRGWSVLLSVMVKLN